MSTNLEINSNSINNIFGVKHYNVKVIKKKEKPLKYIISVIQTKSSSKRKYSYSSNFNNIF